MVSRVAPDKIGERNEFCQPDFLHPSGAHLQVFKKLRAQGTSSKFQTPSSKEAPSSKLKNRAARRLPRHLFWGLEIEIWTFSGAWGLVLGVSLSGRSKTEMRPGRRINPEWSAQRSLLKWFPPRLW